MKTLIKILATISLCGALLPALSGAREFNIIGIPEPVTITSTSLGTGTYSSVYWKKLLDSDLSCSQFYLTNPSASQNLKVTYNSATLTVIDDYVILKPGITMKRDGQTSEGVYINATYAAGAEQFDVIFESWK